MLEPSAVAQDIRLLRTDDDGRMVALQIAIAREDRRACQVSSSLGGFVDAATICLYVMLSAAGQRFFFRVLPLERLLSSMSLSVGLTGLLSAGQFVVYHLVSD